MKMSRIGKAVFLGALGVLLAMTPGCVVIADGGDGGYSSWGSSAATETRTQTLSVAHVSGKPIVVDTANGRVSVVKGGTDEVRVVATIRATTRARAEATTVSAERSGDGALVVRPVFPDNRRQGNEGVSFEITVPDATGVTVDTTNGSVEVRGLAGRAVLSASNGSVTIENHEGDAVLESTNGSIEAKGVRGSIDADTSNGSVRVADAVGTVKADTSNGSIECSMHPSATGPVTLDSSNGSITLTVGPGFGGELIADTSNARVQVNNVKAKSIDTSGSEARIVFENPGPKSVLDTSNARITINGV